MTDELSEGFTRQRRNLFLANVALIYFAVAKVNVAQITFAGFNFNAFENPTVFLSFLWIAWGYFLYRYFLYFIAEALSPIYQVWDRDFNRFVSPLILRIVEDQYGPTRRFSEGNIYRQTRSSNLIYSGSVDVEYCDIKDRHVYTRGFPFKKKLTRWQILGKETQAFFYFCFFSKPVTDYILLFFLSTATIIFSGFISEWEGNLRLLLMAFV